MYTFLDLAVAALTCENHQNDGLYEGYPALDIWHVMIYVIHLSDWAARLFPCEGVSVIVEWSELFQLGLLIVAIIALCLRRRKK